MTEATTGRQRRRVVLSLDPQAAATLADLAEARYAGLRSRACDACVTIAAAVLADVSTHGIADPLAALDAWCRSRGDPAE